MRSSGHAMAWIDNDYKLISNDDGETWELYNLKSYREEVFKLASNNEKLVKK